MTFANPTARTGGKIPAIKELRSSTGCSLKTAKEAIDSVWDVCYAEGTARNAKDALVEDLTKIIATAQANSLTMSDLEDILPNWENLAAGRTLYDDDAVKYYDNPTDTEF